MYTYNVEHVTYLQRQFDNIQSAADNKQSAIAWDIVNKISGRNSVNKAKLKTNTQADRIHIWKVYFSTTRFQSISSCSTNKIYSRRRSSNQNRDIRNERIDNSVKEHKVEESYWNR